MTRRWLGLALLLSLGVNAGVLATLAVERLRGGDAASAAAAGAPPAGDVGPPPGEPPLPAGGPSAPAPPDAQGGDLPPGMEWRLGQLATHMGLEGDRRTEFLEIQRRFFRETRAAHQKGLELQQSLRRELTAPAPERERLTDILGELGSTRQQLDRALVDAVLATRKLLDPEQEREYLQFLARLRGAGEGPQGGPPRNGPPRNGPPPRGPRRRLPPR